ncbi:hypothetical protein BCU68_00700 [Vibrio sp. 10N.286.49.B3]|uniref:L,D-transpeptidase family protein n=1 Tax=Vibrio sp. 10N.286.49.B3 TaxID=1880855 RepID=UPI000CC51D07|nr:L,D-transpeptidase family protein [Vibrio sp. 10N.286.49.B3]PMH46599.1 hypothetical protein BCU68_00700 [Vibrio sp. 10N.286.49.B3]
MNLNKYIALLSLFVSTQLWALDSFYELGWIKPGAKIEKLIQYPKLVDELYFTNQHELMWNNDELANQLEFQIGILDKAQLSPLFSRNVEMLRTYRKQNQAFEYDLLATDTLISYLNYVEQAPKLGMTWFFEDQKIGSLNQSSLAVGEEITPIFADAVVKNPQSSAVQLSKLLDHYAPPVQHYDAFVQAYALLEQQNELKTPLYQQEGLKRSGDALPNKSQLLDRISLAGIDVSALEGKMREDKKQAEIAMATFIDESIEPIEAVEEPNPMTEDDALVGMESASLMATEVDLTQQESAVEVTKPQPYQDTLDNDLLVVVKKFQTMHGLNPDGVIGPKTMKWINIDVDDRIKLLALNAERMRLWPKDRESIIMVNVPAFNMKYWYQGKTVFESRVIVGKTERKTPLMITKLDSVILNPSWNVPRKIMVEDILPKAKRNLSYLSKNKIEIIPKWGSKRTINPANINWNTLNPKNFPYKMRQRSGSNNALGLYKFNTPNAQAIYLHDTPSKGLFNRDSRAYSSGCIRVEGARQFAMSLVDTQGAYKKSRLENSTRSSNARVPLHQKVPVHIIYQTVWFDNGNINYRDDIYEYDHLAAN